MIIKTNEVKYKDIKSDLNNLFKEAFFIDIESTGLSRVYSSIISITILLHEEGNYKIYQIFCEYKIDEQEALKYLKDLIKTKKYIITYNGNSFDLPFLEYKLQSYNINFNFNNFSKIDLYSLIRQFKNKIGTSDLKLKTIESYFNINRNDTLSGKDIITLYEAFRIEPRKEFSYLILQHNYEDVYNLPVLFNRITDLYDTVLFFNDFIAYVVNDDVTIRKDTLICKYNITTGCKTDYVHSSMNFNININNRTSKIEIKIPLGFYSDNKISEFYFIDNTDYNVKAYSAIEGIKKNLIPIKFNNSIFNNNVLNIIIHILNNVFTK
ncbi:ribonuclease H-like domain-containing protein [Sedimentibacter hydroxybenzoicus DSM 7310]|uniref:Ribonuclease H-like domain-containing protein n=1 Tax=Sedimentibacter hydroxybenzoicus DSM 7310 TaxID=1123245 RepID=A0A974BNB8_SEDHY|nr:ribonuclease H-like domain-containing protein [Sedimentibacter hydroxybenzoicus]NYB76081.1 ribonuclease H-like domain-containing protein [Sedimentibacter hydroxybenzoicus DSM 7310]